MVEQICIKASDEIVSTNSHFVDLQLAHKTAVDP